MSITMGLLLQLLTVYLASLPLGCLAQTFNCSESAYITSQEDLDALGRDCSTLDGSVYISGTYTGPFTLSGMRNITGSLKAASLYDASIPQIEHMELPGLEILGGTIDLPNLVANNFSAPLLQSAWGVYLGQEAHGSEVHFPSLMTVDQGVRLIGNYSKINLDSLQTVTNSLVVCSVPDCAPGSAINQVDLSLPALTSVGGLDIVLKTSSISMPALTALENFDLVYPMMEIQALDTPASISMPKFENLIGMMKLSGELSSIDLSSLLRANQTISVDTSHPLNVSLPLQAGVTLTFEGAIEEVHLPALTTFRTLHINSSLPLDCREIDDTFNKIKDDINSESGYPVGYSCKSSREYPSGLSTGAKAGIGVGVGVAGLVVIGAGLWWWKKRKARPVKSASTVHLTNMTPAGGVSGQEEDEAPPAYTPRQG
ncbi:hypothetical protein BDV18DRAFT_142294 [Aspergillus unguis]